MSFASFGDFLAMGHHGLYVWSAYGICLAVLALNVAAQAVSDEVVVGFSVLVADSLTSGPLASAGQTNNPE